MVENHWIITPSYFESPEPALLSIAPPKSTINAVTIKDRTPLEMAKLHAPIRAFTEATIDNNDRPILLAGDCCGALPVLSALQHSGIHPTLIWFDAHADFNTPETSPSQFLGGMPLAMISGRGPQWLCDSNELTPLEDHRIILVDARDLDPLEKEAVKASGIQHVRMQDILSMHFDGPVHLHFDTDLINADECAAFNYPVSGGPFSQEVKQTFEAMAKTADIRAVSVSGWTGALDTDGAAGKIFGDILSVFGAVKP